MPFILSVSLRQKLTHAGRDARSTHTTKRALPPTSLLELSHVPSGVLLSADSPDSTTPSDPNCRSRPCTDSYQPLPALFSMCVTPLYHTPRRKVSRVSCAFCAMINQPLCVAKVAGLAQGRTSVFCCGWASLQSGMAEYSMEAERDCSVWEHDGS